MAARASVSPRPVAVGGIEPGPQEVLQPGMAAAFAAHRLRLRHRIGRVGVRVPFHEQRRACGDHDCEESDDHESHERPFVPVVGPWANEEHV